MEELNTKMKSLREARKNPELLERSFVEQCDSNGLETVRIMQWNVLADGN